MRRPMENLPMHRLCPITSTLAIFALVAGAACSRPQAPPSAALESAVAAAKILPFIENDYAAALTLAQTNKTPLFVELWAPW